MNESLYKGHHKPFCGWRGGSDKPMNSSWKKHDSSKVCHDLREFQGKGWETAAVAWLEHKFKTLLELPRAGQSSDGCRFQETHSLTPKGTYIMFSFKLEWHKKAADSLSPEPVLSLPATPSTQQRCNAPSRGPQSRLQGNHYRVQKYVFVDNVLSSCW